MRRQSRILAFVVMSVFLTVILNVGIAFGAPQKTTKAAKQTKPAAKAAAKVASKPQKQVTKPVKKVPVIKETRAQIEADLKALVQQNITASNSGDTKAYMSTIFKQEPVFSQTEQMMDQIFAAYKLDFKLIDFSVINIVGDTATISVTMECRKISGPEFNDNKTVANHVIKKQNGVWKFFSSKVVSAELLKPVTTDSAIDATTTGAVDTTGSAVSK